MTIDTQYIALDIYNKSFNFTGLPDDTSFNITILGIIMTGELFTNPSSTFVRTLSMYIAIILLCPQYCMF